MSTYAGTTERRLYRDKDKAVLGGVCAGLAEYLGFNLKVTRFLAFITFLCAMPFAIIGYLAAVFLIPSSSSKAHVKADYEELRKEQLREEIRRAKPDVEEVRRRYKSMDERLAKIEQYVTSSQYELDEKLRRL
jgi:phage shock protein C